MGPVYRFRIPVDRQFRNWMMQAIAHCGFDSDSTFLLSKSVANSDCLYKPWSADLHRTRTISPTPPAIEVSTPGKSSWDPPPPPLLPLNGFCLGEGWYNPSSPSGVYPLLHGVLVPVHRWYPLMKFGSPPLPRTSVAPRLGFARSAFRSLRSRCPLSLPSPLRSTFPYRLCGPVGEHFG